jgi:uncharacterized membrane protein (DUF441 family)
MLNTIKQFLASKKWLAVLLGIVIAVLVNYGVIGADLGHTIEVALGLGVAAQAVTDHGKSAAQIAADANGIATSPGSKSP